METGCKTALGSKGGPQKLWRWKTAGKAHSRCSPHEDWRSWSPGQAHSPQGEVADTATMAPLTFAPLAEAGGAEQGQDKQPGTHLWQHIHPLPPETKRLLHCREPRDGNGPGYGQGSSHSPFPALTSWGNQGWKELLSSSGHESKAKDGLSSAQASAQGSKLLPMPPLCLELGDPARHQGLVQAAGAQEAPSQSPELPTRESTGQPKMLLFLAC